MTSKVTHVGRRKPAEVMADAEVPKESKDKLGGWVQQQNTRSIVYEDTILPLPAMRALAGFSLEK